MALAKGKGKGKSKGKGNDGLCYNCGKPGHIAANCWLKGKEKAKVIGYPPEVKAIGQPPGPVLHGKAKVMEYSLGPVLLVTHAVNLLTSAPIAI